MTDQQIEIFTTQDGQAQISVALDKDTVCKTAICKKSIVLAPSHLPSFSISM